MAVLGNTAMQGKEDQYGLANLAILAASPVYVVLYLERAGHLAIAHPNVSLVSMLASYPQYSALAVPAVGS